MKKLFSIVFLFCLIYSTPAWGDTHQTNQRHGVVLLTVIDSSEIDKMQLGYPERHSTSINPITDEEPNPATIYWDAEEAFAGEREFEITSVGDGTKCIYGRVQDIAGNWGPISSACLELDTAGETVIIKFIKVIIDVQIGVGD